MGGEGSGAGFEGENLKGWGGGGSSAGVAALEGIGEYGNWEGWLEGRVR